MSVRRSALTFHMTIAIITKSRNPSPAPVAMISSWSGNIMNSTWASACQAEKVKGSCSCEWGTNISCGQNTQGYHWQTEITHFNTCSLLFDDPPSDDSPCLKKRRRIQLLINLKNRGLCSCRTSTYLLFVRIQHISFLVITDMYWTSECNLVTVSSKTFKKGNILQSENMSVTDAFHCIE